MPGIQFGILCGPLSAVFSGKSNFVVGYSRFQPSFRGLEERNAIFKDSSGWMISVSLDGSFLLNTGSYILMVQLEGMATYDRSHSAHSPGSPLFHPRTVFACARCANDSQRDMKIMRNLKDSMLEINKYS